MSYSNASVVFWAWMGTAGLLLTGCPGDDGNGDEGAASSGSTSMASTSATDNPTGGSNNTMTASGEGSGGSTMGSADATATQGSESATQGSESESASGDTTTAGETEGGVCDGLGAMECMSTEGCMPIVGSPIDASGVGGTPCLDEREFIECQPAIGCGDAITYACEGDDAQMYQFLDTCIPVGWVECGPRPPGELPPCGG